MRIAIGGYSHETNTFGSILVTQERIDRLTVTSDKYFDCYTGVHNVYGGFIAEAKRLGIELIPTITFNPGPSGPTEKKAFEGYRDRLTSLLWQAHCQAPLDGIVLCLHGAGIAQGYDDLEGELLRDIRQRFGATIPIAVNLDLHANVTPQMLALSDIMVGFKCYPHVDGYETAVDTVRLLHQMILQGKPFGKALISLPWFIPPACGVTLSGPGHCIQQYVYHMIAEDPQLLDATFFHGFCYADVPFAGVSIVTVAQTQEDADRCAQQIAQYAWSRHKAFSAPIYSAEQAMELAEKAPYPVVINESSDNPGGGSPGDGTHLLRSMLKKNLPGSAFGYIYDPEVANQAAAAGAGKYICCKLGGKNDNIHGAPIELDNAYVKAVSDGIFIQKNPMGAGGRVNLGLTVLLVVGNVQIVVASYRTQTLDDGPFHIVGIDWQKQRILALKSSQHFKGWWADRAKAIIPCDSPGIHSADLASFHFERINTGAYPFTDAVWN